MFEKNYIDCNLEETNCTTLVITPSTGVFEVDEELTSLTRKRLVENGKLKYFYLKGMCHGKVFRAYFFDSSKKKMYCLLILSHYTLSII